MLLRKYVAAALPPSLLTVAVHKELYAPRLRRRPIALVYGNCQAEAVRRILSTHAGFAREYQLLRVPAVHEITERQLALIKRRLPVVDVLIAQQVKDGYRDMELGTDQLIEHLRPDARVVRWPVAYYEGLHPFLAYINLGSPIAVDAPITSYHDVRIIYAAQQGWGVERTVEFLRDFHVDPAWIRDTAEGSLVELARREERLDVKLSGAIADPAVHLHSFMTVNHPSNRLITEVAKQTLDHLGIANSEVVLEARQTYLDHLMAPREPQVLAALGLDGSSTQSDWIVHGTAVPLRDVVEAHLAQYAEAPELVPAGMNKHTDRLQALGLAAA